MMDMSKVELTGKEIEDALSATYIGDAVMVDLKKLCQAQLWKLLPLLEEMKREERERVRQALNKQNIPDAKEWETGTGGHLHKVLLFTKDEWTKFWQALQQGKEGE